MARKPARDHTGRKIPKARPDAIVEAGILKRDGGQLDQPLFGSDLIPEVEAAIRRYRPRKSPWSELWKPMAEFVVRIVLLVCPPTVESARHSMIAVTRFAGWALQQGLELKEEELFQPLRVEEFTAAIVFLGPSGQKNMRSRLRAIGRGVTRRAPWPAEPTRLRRPDLRPPYTPAEIDLLLHDINRQYKTIKRAAEVTHHLGLGAGLRPMALRIVTADDLVERYGALCVTVDRGSVTQCVPILPVHVPAVVDLAERYPEGPLIHEWAHRKTVGAMLADFRVGRSTPRPSTWRYRSTWLLSHLALGTRLDVLATAAGVREQRGLTDLLKYLPPLDEADVVRMLGGAGMNIPECEVDRHNWETVCPLAACVMAAWTVDRATKVVAVLESRLNWRPDRQLPLRTLLIGVEMLGILGRRSHHRQVRLALRSLPENVQRTLGVIDAAGRVVTYRQIEKAVCPIAGILKKPTILVDHDHDLIDKDTGEVLPCPFTCPYTRADHNWFMAAMAQASIPDDIPRAQDMAMDSTDMETWAKSLFRFTADFASAPGDAPGDYHDDAAKAAAAAIKSAKGSSEAEPTTNAPTGPDDRAVPSKDEDARWGHRARRTGVSPFFVGYDCHTLLGVPGRTGRPYAPFVEAVALVPAASYPGDAAVAVLRLARHYDVQVRDLIADRGYSRLDFNRFGRPMKDLADNVVFDLVQWQQKRQVDYTAVLHRGTPKERTVRILRIAGGFFSDALPGTPPDNLHDLKRPVWAATKSQRQATQRAFDRRAQYAFVRHDVLPSGSQRWAGPATSYAGFKVRCPNNPPSMRAPHERPLTSCTEGVPCSCGEVVVIDDPETERERQNNLWGGTGWTKSYNRRTVVERGYADDKFQITNFDRSSVYCFGTVKHAFYYSPIIVARNLQVSLRWYRDTGQPDPWGIENIGGPDYQLPPELGGLGLVEGAGGDDDPEAPDDVIEAGAEEDTEAGAGATDTGDEDMDLGTDSGRSGLNREQRRAAARRARGRGKKSSKPSKPPPRGVSPPVRQ